MNMTSVGGKFASTALLIAVVRQPGSSQSTLSAATEIAVCYGIVTVLSVETVDVKTNRRRIVPMESQPPIEVYAGYPVRLAKSK